MGEIKSTLDLVLEKTRHLSLSEEEKRQQKRQDALDRLSGLLQRYLDGKLDIDRLEEDLDQLVQSDGGPDEPNVREEIMRRIELGGGSEKWLALLQTRYGLDTFAVRKVEEEFQQAIATSAKKRKGAIKKELQEQRLISGSAVAPNLDADPSWSDAQRTVAEKYHDRLKAALSEIAKIAAEQRS